MAEIAGPALSDGGHRVQADVLRHGARLPVVAVPAVDAVRGHAGGVYAPPAVLDRRPLSGPAADEHRAVWLLLGGHKPGGAIDRVQRGDRAQDPVPPPGD